MRVMTRALVGAVAALGIAAGSLAGAGTAFAAPAPTANTAAAAQPAAQGAVVNLGLNFAEAMNVQMWLRSSWDYDGEIDGQLGPESWKAFQRVLSTAYGYYDGPIDGIVGKETVKALQRFLTPWGYRGAIDGSAGPQTRGAFQQFARSCIGDC